MTHLNAKASAKESAKIADTLEDLESEVVLAVPQIGTEEAVNFPPDVCISMCDKAWGGKT